VPPSIAAGSPRASRPSAPHRPHAQGAGRPRRRAAHRDAPAHLAAAAWSLSVHQPRAQQSVRTRAHRTHPSAASAAVRSGPSALAATERTRRGIGRSARSGQHSRSPNGTRRHQPRGRAALSAARCGNRTNPTGHRALGAPRFG
jgi:hypothetical protein